MNTNRLKIKFTSINYIRAGEFIYCVLRYSVYLNKECISNNYDAIGACFACNEGEKVARAVAELKIYRQVKSYYASFHMELSIYEYYKKRYKPALECMYNTHVFLNKQIKNKIKYIHNVTRRIQKGNFN